MGRKINLDMVKEKARLLNLDVLSNEYISAKSPLVVKCKNGHISNKTWDTIKSGKGCRICSGAFKKDYSYVKQEFKKYGFELLEDTYKCAKNKMKVMCENGHITYKTGDGVVNKSRGCSVCNPQNVKKRNRRSENDIRKRRL